MIPDAPTPPPAARPEPRWPAMLTLLAVGFLDAALPNRLILGERWLPLLLVAILLVPKMFFYRTGNYRYGNVAWHISSATVTLFMAWSVGDLIYQMPRKTVPPLLMLRSAAALWACNVMIFALWYWRLDRGGPHRRAMGEDQRYPGFLFPQMQLHDHLRPMNWRPEFIDYLFLAFNTSTALSPTDVPVLSRYAKVLVMTQSLISLSIIVVIAARAVNII